MGEKEPYWLQRWINTHRATSGVVAGIIAVLTFTFALWWLFSSPGCKANWKWLGQWLAAIWAVGPPVYFFFEWWSWAPRNPADRKTEFEEFKHSQDVAAKVWIGFAATLAVIFGLKL